MQCFLQHVMSGLECPEHVAVAAHGAYIQLWSPGEDSPISKHVWNGLCSVVNLSHMQTCLLPLARRGVPMPLRQMGLSCITNHPHAGAAAHAQQDPFTLLMHEFFASDGCMDMYFVHVPAPLLDMLLPLCIAHARHLVLALVPVSYMESRHAHRAAYFMDEVWSQARGLFIRIVGPTGHIDPMGWLLLFPDANSRNLVMHGRVAHHTSEVLWDSRCPRMIVPLRGLHLLHIDLVHQGVRASTRWLQVLARRGGVMVAALPHQVRDPPRSLVQNLEYAHLAP